MIIIKWKLRSSQLRYWITLYIYIAYDLNYCDSTKAKPESASNSNFIL